MRITLLFSLLFGLGVLSPVRIADAAPTPTSPGAAYDPLALLPTATLSAPEDLSIWDDDRHREIPVRIYLPALTAGHAAPVVLFSHGLGGSRDGNTWLAEHWARRGYAVVFVQHPGSDSGVWQGVPRHERMAAMRAAASADNFVLRVRDVVVVLNQLEQWNDPSSAHALSGRLDFAHVGMSGHSFGAVTTQALAGQEFQLPDGKISSLADPRIKAALLMSPSLPRRGNAAAAFGHVGIPWLLMTGSNDAAPIGGATAASRRGVYPALPAGEKYELVLDGAEHSAFTDRGLPGDSRPRNPNHHRAILALSTAFWDATLGNNAAARAWLDGPGALSVLQSADAWQRK